MVKELADYHWCVKETLNAYILQEIFIYFPSSTMRPPVRSSSRFICSVMYQPGKSRPRTDG